MGEPTNTLEGLVGFARALRHSGVNCGPDRARSFLAATGHVDFADRAQLYWAGRLTLCSEPDDFARFDAAFRAWFDGSEASRTADAPEAQPRWTTGIALGAEEGGDSEQEEAEDLAVAAADVEVLHRRDLADLDAAEREQLRKLFAWLRPEPPKRPALRKRPARNGELDPNATMREMLRAGGEPVRLPKRRRGHRPRKIVLLIDVSGSMSAYADALLRFAHVVVRHAPFSTEVFTLGTRMTRVTRQLRQRDPDTALRAAAHAVPDFSGGTRLGETIRAFLNNWGRRGVARRAVVVVFSDGWERGGVEELTEQMSRLRRLAYAVLWSNPHAGRSGYEPVQSGIVAALPYLDGLVAGHSLRALRTLWAEVRRLGGGRQAEPSGSESVEVGRA